MDIQQFKIRIYDVVGAILEVHKELGPGLNESCYQEGLEREFRERGVKAERELSFHPSYHGVPMDSLYRIDFLCQDDIIVECKSVEQITQVHRAQLYNYMRLLSKPCGILVNFAPHYCKVERYFYDAERKAILTVDGKVLTHTR